MINVLENFIELADLPQANHRAIALKRTRQKKYSVLLQYPDYMTDGQVETHYSFVEATCVEHAIEAARQKAIETTQFPNEDQADFITLLVLKGHNFGLAIPEEE